MTKCQKKAALQYLMFLKQRRCRKIKGRGCKDGKNYCEYLTKDDTSVPTVATEALFLRFLINTMEHREVATVDIPGAFIQADIESETVYMKMEGKMVDILTKFDSKMYHKYITT